MSKGKVNNCRLCLKILDSDDTVIEGIKRESFEVPLLKVELSVNEDPLVCKRCMESIQEAYVFKSTCISVDEQVVSLAINRNCGELDIRDVYLNENENKNLAFNEDYNICRFCLQCLEKSKFILLSDLRKNSANEMLLKCLPELDLNVIKESVVCAVCTKSLESYYNFAMKCQNLEENIMEYSEGLGTDCDGQMSLSNILKFLFKGMLECSTNRKNIMVLKSEDDLFQNEGEVYSHINNIIVKVEEEEDEVIVKDENMYIDCKTEENRCREIEQKEVVTYNMLPHKVSLKKRKLSRKDSSKVIFYKCNLCNHQTKRKSYLKNHMLTHKDSSDVVMFKCTLCTFETKHKRALKRHNMLIHDDNSEVTMYKCKLCSYEAKWQNCLRVHMLTHKDSSDVATYRCERCTFESKYKDNLKKHKLIHKDNSEVPMYKCNLCSYEAKMKDYLINHMLSHKDSSEVVIFRCKLCTFETKRKTTLKKHMLVHKDSSEVVMYKCELCSFRSKYKGSFKRHARIHIDSSELTVQVPP